MKFKIGNIKSHWPYIAAGGLILLWIYHNHKKAQYAGAYTAGYYPSFTAYPHYGMRSYPAVYKGMVQRSYQGKAGKHGGGGAGGGGAGGQTQTQAQVQPAPAASQQQVQCRCPDGSISTASFASVPDEFLESDDLAQAYMSYAYASKKKKKTSSKGKKAKTSSKGKGGYGGTGGGKGGGGGGKGGGGAAGAGAGGGDGAGGGGGYGGGADGGGAGAGAADTGAGAAAPQPTTAAGGVLTCNCPPSTGDLGQGAVSGNGGSTDGSQIPDTGQDATTSDTSQGMQLPSASIPSASGGPGLMFDPSTNQWIDANTGQPAGNTAPLPTPAVASQMARAFNAIPLMNQQDEDLYDDYGQINDEVINGSVYASNYYPYDEDSQVTPNIFPPSPYNYTTRPSNLF